MAKPRRPAKRRGKRPYVTPKLTVHGNLREITLAKGSDKNDGGAKPNTRNPAGGPAWAGRQATGRSTACGLKLLSHYLPQSFGAAAGLMSGFFPLARP